jgi:hypothetical protein
MTDLTVLGIMEEAKRRGDPMLPYILVREAMQIVDEMDGALHRWNQHASRHRSGIWWHIPDGGIVPAGSNRQDEHGIDRPEFERAAGQYLARPWMQHDHLDWCIIDALVRWEWAAFYYDITDTLPAKLSEEAEIKRFSRWFLAAFYTAFFGLPMWGIQHLYHVDSPWAMPAALLFVIVAGYEAFGIIRGRRWRRRAKVAEMELKEAILTVERKAYMALDGAALSPTRVRDAMQAAQDKGVIYPRLVWPVIDAAVARNPHIWRVSPPDEMF